MALRSGLKYKNLGHHVFTAKEKQWACSHLTADRVGDIAHVVCAFVKRYHIDIDIVESWIRSYMCGCELEAGRATIICPFDRISTISIMKFYRIAPQESETDEAFALRAIELMKFELCNTEMRRQ